MADATSSNFGQSRPDEYGDVKMSVGGVPVDPRTAGTFQVNKVVRATPFDPYARLASTQSSARIKVDGIQKAGEPRKILNKEGKIRLRVRVEFLIKEAEEFLKTQTGLYDDAGRKVVEETFGGIIENLREAEKSLLSASPDTETINRVEKIITESEEKIASNKEEHQLNIDKLQEEAARTDHLTESVFLAGKQLEVEQALARQAEEAKNEAERKVFLMGLTTRYEKISSDAERLKATPFPILNKNQILARYDSFSFLKRTDAVSNTDLDSARDNLPQLEADIASAITELTALEKEEERRKRQLEMSAVIAINNFENNKRLEAASLLQNSATLTAKDATEALVAEIGALGTALLSDDVTQLQITEFNQKLLELDAQIVTLKRLIEEGSVEKMTMVRQAEQLIALFEQKKSAAESLLLNPVNTAESATTRTLIAETEIISSSLKRSTDITKDEVDTFIAKIVELEDKVAELQASVDAENSRQESMFSWHADWPKTIKHSEGKKANREGKGGEKAGWKKDNVLLPAATQPTWSRANDQAKRIFEKYNDVLRKANETGMLDSVKELIAEKEAIIKALYAEKPEDALILLVKLEKGVDVNKGAIENAAELKDLSERFKQALTTLDYLTPTLTTLEKTLLNAKKQELTEDLAVLNEAETKKETVRSKGLLNLFRAKLEGLLLAVSEKEKENTKSVGIRLSEFRDFDTKIENLRATISLQLKGFLSDEAVTDLKKRLSDIERDAKKVARLEAEKKHTEARKLSSIAKDDLLRLSDEVSRHINFWAEREAPKQSERIAEEHKKIEKRDAFAKKFSDAKGYFKKLKGELETMSFAAGEKEAFDKRSQELTELIASFESETDQTKAKDISNLFMAILGEFSTFVINKFGNPDRIEEKLQHLRTKLAATSTKSGKRDIEEQIEDLVHAEKKIEELENAYKLINGGRSKRPEVLRPKKGTATVSAKVTTRDPITNKATTAFQEMTVDQWNAQQKGGSAVKESVIEERKRKTAEALRTRHREMWERDKEGYISLYAGRVWGPEDKLTKEIVEGFLKEKVVEVQEKMNQVSAKIMRRGELTRIAEGRELTDAEINEITGIDELIAPFIQEQRDLTERPYEEQMQELRSKTLNDSPRKVWTFAYNPSLDTTVDWIGFDNRPLTKEERKRFVKGKLLRKMEAIRTAKDKIAGVTKEATSGPATSITRGDLGEDNEKLAGAAFRDTAKVGTSGTEKIAAGMARNVAEQELRDLKDGTLDAMADAIENGTKLDTKGLSESDKAFKNLVDNGLYQEPIQAVEKRALTQEEQERRMSKVTSLIETVKKFGKDNWRVFVNIILAGAGGLGAAGLATAATLDGARSTTTLGQVASWKDFVTSAATDERKVAMLMQFIKDLTG